MWGIQDALRMASDVVNRIIATDDPQLRARRLRQLAQVAQCGNGGRALVRQAIPQ